MVLPVQEKEFEVLSRLRQMLGLNHEDLQDVIMQGLHARTICSKNHPKTYPGLSQWAETVRALRDKTAPFGWASSDENNFPLCIHPSDSFAIAVYTGDKDTGVASGNPSNRAAKGTNTERAVWSNQKQLYLFETLSEVPSAGGKSDRIMWVLLYHVADKEIRYELSLPMVIIGGKIQSWQERLIFPPIPLDQVNIVFEDEDAPEFEVHVERRS
ncbi:MAG: hypothetical protein V4443_12180 [Pseudomonadota bacterium]